MFGYRIDFVVNDTVIDTYTRKHKEKETLIVSRVTKGFLNKDDKVEIRVTPFTEGEKQYQSQEEKGNTVKIKKAEIVINQMRHYK